MDAQIQELVSELRLIILKDATPNYMKVDKAAEFLSITKNALTVMAHKRQIPYIKRLGKLYFLQSDLIDWPEEGRVVSKATAPEDILISKNKKTA